MVSLATTACSQMNITMIAATQAKAGPITDQLTGGAAERIAGQGTQRVEPL